MRIATAASAAVLALSTAALAQVADPAGTPASNNMIMSNVSGPGNSPTPAPAADATPTAGNMLDTSASPPLTSRSNDPIPLRSGLTTNRSLLGQH